MWPGFMEGSMNHLTCWSLVFVPKLEGDWVWRWIFVRNGAFFGNWWCWFLRELYLLWNAVIRSIYGCIATCRMLTLWWRICIATLEFISLRLLGFHPLFVIKLRLVDQRSIPKVWSGDWLSYLTCPPSFYCIWMVRASSNSSFWSFP